MDHLNMAEHDMLLANEGMPELRIENDLPGFNPPFDVLDSPPRFSDYAKMTFGNILLFCYSLLKIGFCCFICFKEDSICSEPLDIWLILVLINESILLVYLLIAFYLNQWLHNKKLQNEFLGQASLSFGRNLLSLEEVSSISESFESSELIQFLNHLDNYNFHLRLNHEAEKGFVFMTYLRHMNQFSYLMLFLWGCFLLTMKNSNCAMVCPHMHTFCLILLGISLLYIFLPLLLLVSICFCIPCLLISSLFCGPTHVKSIERDFVKKLDRKEFSSSEFTEHDDCVICRSSFVKKEKIIVLPCNKKHYFHEACVEKWLDISCLCPICRADLNKKMMDEDVKNNMRGNGLNNIVLGILEEDG